MLEKITTALTELKPQGAFSAKKTTDVTDLHIEIKPVGRLKFPIKPAVAKKLIKVAKPATFGWREETRLDTEVRDVWKIPKSRVKIDKRRWNQTLNPTVERLKDELGLPQQSRLKAELHDMLIYAPGQFFLSHQDSEKSDGMVATLVVVLPSPHSGGTLIVDHQGEKKRYQSSRAADKLTFFAFYADCHHEVKPVKEGYRIALVYNLLLNGEDETLAILPTPAAQQVVTGALENYFASSFDKEATGHPRTSKLVYFLDHEYTPKGLSWKRLKNGDRLRAAALSEAAGALDLEIYLALADIEEMWDCESQGWDYRSGRRHWGYDDEEDDNDNEEDVELLYLVDGSTTIKHWRDTTGATVRLPVWQVGDEECCWTKANDALTPFKSEYEGWMGNYGNTMERWYHRAAIILWRRDERYGALLDIAPELMVRELLPLAQKKATRPQAQVAVEQLLPNWSGFQRYETKSSSFSAVFRLALKLERSDLARPLLLPLGIDAFSPQTAQAMIRLQTAYGAAWLVEIIQHWFTTPSYLENGGMIDKLTPLIKRWVEQSADAHHTVTHWLQTHQLDALTQQHNEQAGTESVAVRQRDASERVKQVIDLLNAALASRDDVICNSTIDYLIDNENNYFLLDLVAIARHIKRQRPKFNTTEQQRTRFLAFVRNKLITVLDSPPRQADDWSIIVTDRCGCADCQELNTFLQASDLTHKTWPLAKGRRQHIHGIVEGMSIPVSHQTERSGSPHKLHLNKCEQLFKDSQMQREQLEEALCVLQASF